MKIKEIVNALEIFAPLPLQDGFDNAGLQIGLTDAEATGALLCLDVTEAVVDEAIALGYNLIVSHHPLIFKGYKSITGRDYFFRSFIRHTTCRSRMIIYRHRIFLTLPQKGYATVSHGGSHIGSKLLLRHVIQSFVPYADKQFLHNIFRVVLVRNISIGYTAQP